MIASDARARELSARYGISLDEARLCALDGFTDAYMKRTRRQRQLMRVAAWVFVYGLFFPLASVVGHAVTVYWWWCDTRITRISTSWRRA